MRTIAKDKRNFDAEGRLHVTSSNISKANCCRYLGSEISDWQELGLDPNRTYVLYRDAGELAKAAPTFANLPLLRDHKPISADAPARELWVGVVGAPVKFEAPYLKAPLSLWTAEAIDLVESGEQEQLSAAYRFRADMTPGIHRDGTRFDGVMRDIIGNHVALVSEGRAGPDVLVGDSKPKRQSQVADLFPSLRNIRRG